MRELSLFTGGGGGVWGTKLLGWTTVGYVEWNEYCQQIIAARIRDGFFDYAPIFTDIRAFAAEYAEGYRGLVDVITAGFPCQPFSAAGKRRADADERNMWPSTLQVIKAVQPKWCLLENVPGLLGKHRYFETILKDLSEAGYDAKWTCLSAAEIGAPHKRERLWILAFPNTNNCGFERWEQLTKGGEEERNVANSESVGSQGSDKSSSGGEIKVSKVIPESPGNNSGSGGWWATEPNVGRVVNGVAARSNRIKTLGNGQVSAVVRAAWQELIYEHEIL